MLKDVAVEAAWDMFDPVSGYEGDYADFASTFALGAEWALAGMAVCEFLSDLAALVTPRKTFFAYSPDTGFDTYATAHEAEAAACESLEGYAEDAGGTLWDSDVESVCWGEVVEKARQTSRRPVEAGENPDADEIVTYGLLP